MANVIVEQLKKRKKELEAELKQVNVALGAFAVKAVVPAKTVPRKPMSEEAKQKIRDAQLRRHQPIASNVASTSE